MKPRNFPERKRQRQIVALERLEETPGEKRSYNQRAEIRTLLQRVAENVRSVRTKKEGGRSARAG